VGPAVGEARSCGRLGHPRHRRGKEEVADQHGEPVVADEVHWGGKLKGPLARPSALVLPAPFRPSGHRASAGIRQGSAERFRPAARPAATEHSRRQAAARARRLRAAKKRSRWRWPPPRCPNVRCRAETSQFDAPEFDRALRRPKPVREIGEIVLIVAESASEVEISRPCNRDPGRRRNRECDYSGSPDRVAARLQYAVQVDGGRAVHVLDRLAVARRANLPGNLEQLVGAIPGGRNARLRGRGGIGRVQVQEAVEAALPRVDEPDQLRKFGWVLAQQLVVHLKFVDRVLPHGDPDFLAARVLRHDGAANPALHHGPGQAGERREQRIAHRRPPCRTCCLTIWPISRPLLRNICSTLAASLAWTWRWTSPPDAPPPATVWRSGSAYCAGRTSSLR